MDIRGDIVKQLRLQNNWTQQHLANCCGVSLRTIQRIEKHSSASMETMMSLCSVFAVPRERLFEVPRPNENDKPESVNLKPYYN